MYQILGISRALTLFGLLCVGVITLWATIAPPTNPASLWDWWKIGSGAVSGSAFAITLIGQSFVFPLLCDLPLIRKWFPPLDGDWKATLESNWPAIQERAHPGSSAPPRVPVLATVTIVARLFHIRMTLTADSRYSTSKTIFVRATRDPEDGSIMLHYLYRNTTNVPEQTDSAAHDGAANLEVISKNKTVWLEGVYWTNRNWHLGLNTAGRITLRK